MKTAPQLIFLVIACQLSSIGTAPAQTNDDWLQLYPQHPKHQQSIEKTQPRSFPPPPEPQSTAPLFIEPLPPPPPPPERYPRYFPALSAGSPSGFGANWGDISLGAAIINREGAAPTNPNARAGGSVAITFGIGDSRDFLGLETTYNIISVTPSRFAQNGNFDFKIHKNLGNLSSIALGWQNAINYGPEAGGTESSVYGAFSQIYVLQPDNPENPMLLGFTIGIGGGVYRPFFDQINQVSSVGVFSSAGWQALPNVSLIGDWNGQGMNFGVSYVPFRDIPITLTGIAVDVFNNTTFQTRYLLSGSLTFRFN